MFEAMLEGWRRQQAARRLTGPLIDGRVRLVRRFAGFTGAWPWQWTPAQGEAWVASGGAMGGNRSHAGHRSSSLGQRPKAVRHRRQRAGGGPGRRADRAGLGRLVHGQRGGVGAGNRKSTRLNSSHANISYAVFCLKKNKTWLAKGQGIASAPCLSHAQLDDQTT